MAEEKKKSPEFTLEEMTQKAFQIITFAGSARSDGMEAIAHARKKEYDKARAKIKEGHQNIVDSEKLHMDLIQAEAQGKNITVPLILMHAEDQMLTAQAILLIGEEFITLYEKVNSIETKSGKMTVNIK